MKKVLLYSGGLDSVLANFLWEPDLLLHLATNAEYMEAEVNHLKKFTPFREEKLLIDNETFDFEDMEQEHSIVPFRNMYYILRALHYGQHVMLGANKADVSNDKDGKFQKVLTSLIKHVIKDPDPNDTCYAPDSWRTLDFKIDFPSLPYTKPELVKMALNKGIDPEVLKNTRTCYDPESHIGCGDCSPCLQKEIALTLNGISSSFEKDPMIYLRRNKKFLLEVTDPRLIPRKELVLEYLKLRG